MLSDQQRQRRRQGDRREDVVQQAIPAAMVSIAEHGLGA